MSAERKRGEGRTFRRGRIWWVAYCIDGIERRESSGSEDERVADKLLERRLFELEEGKTPVRAKERKRTIADLCDALEADYAARKCDSAHNLKSVLRPIREALGFRRAANVSTADLSRLIVTLRDQGYADETVNRTMRCLRQAFGLQSAIRIPKFPPLPHGRPRDVLVTPDQQRALLAAMDDSDYCDAVEFKFETGWRGGEVLSLEWPDIRHDTIRLKAQNTKTEEPRDYPVEGVAEIISRRRAVASRVTGRVFHKNGKPLSYECWRHRLYQAAVKAGLGSFDANGCNYQGPKLHDSRRSAGTELIDSGVDPQVAMLLLGHKSDSMLRRYRIIKAETLAKAVRRRQAYVEQQRTANSNVVSLDARRVGQLSDNSDEQPRKANGE
jgi:integrase